VARREKGGEATGKTGTSLNKTQKILATIDAEAQQKIRGMEDILEDKLAKMSEENSRTLALELDDIKREKDRSLALQENRIIAEAELSARRVVEAAREKMVQEAISEAKELLDVERQNSSPVYREFLKKRGEEAKKILPPGSTAEVLPGDSAASILSSMGFKTVQTLPKSAIGGAVFHAPDGKRHLDCTILHRITRDMVELRAGIFDSLFSEPKPKPDPVKQKAVVKRNIEN